MAAHGDVSHPGADIRFSRVSRARNAARRGAGGRTGPGGERRRWPGAKSYCGWARPAPLRGTLPTAGYRDLFRNRSFRWLSLAGAGSFAAPTASLVVLLYAITVTFLSSAHPVESAALALALLGLSSTVPTLGTAVFSGTIADRVDRRRLLRWVNAAALLATFGILLLLDMRPESTVAIPGDPWARFPEWILLLYPLWAIETTAVTLFRPAFNAAVPMLVPTESLGRANGAIYAIALGFSIGGSLAAGFVTNTQGPAIALVLPIVLFALTQVFLLGVDRPLSAPRAGPPAPFLRDAANGYRYLWARRPILTITVAALAINFFSAVAFVELGLYVVDWLGVNDALLVGAMIAGGSLGAATGTLLVNRFRFEARAGRFLVVLVVLQGVTVGVLGVVRTIWIALPDMFLFGLFPGMFTTVFLATIQATVPNDLLGRVLAADEVGSFAMIPVGQFLGGTIAALYGVPLPFLLAGIGTVLVGLLLGAVSGVRALGFTPHGGGPPDGRPPPTPAASGEL